MTEHGGGGFGDKVPLDNFWYHLTPDPFNNSLHTEPVGTLSGSMTSIIDSGTRIK